MTNKKNISIDKPYFPASEQFNINDFPFYWVALLNSKYSIEMEKTLKKIDLDITRWRIVMLLKIHGEMSISDICQHAVAKLPTITKIVYRMQDKNLVTVKSSSKDGRVSVVAITNQGLDKIQETIKTTSDLFNQAFKGFSEAEINRMNKLNKKLLSNLF
ncbi:MarR family winged helix-turn-helix transcriptional regulator [Aliikangiella sp. IMCC44359]|uniref:MarR family winged helix-turn-helix transcriptional regulator n=1 Tax=Aliikangiella sp. IMCC44359 TaxID=3459125 RepID=UPI00403B27E7